MAPEMLMEGAKFDNRIETWSLGVILCKMLTNKMPFDGKTDTKLVKQIVME